ncbi:hypothetical protein Megpolyxen_01408 [Candidatus Megaera polyxenophila]|nr:hypothetical protein Megpolyxen_01408 [Candidatus Megaera polyxenophila]
MSIDQFTRDAAYFQTRRDSGMLLNAEDLDFQFNNLIDYLNTKIVPIINNFIGKEFVGVANPALENACLLNIGDGNTKWQKIDSNIFSDYSIARTKFTPVTPFSIIATNLNSNWGPVTTRLNDSILFSRNKKTPIWRKVATGDIANKTLIGGHIALGAIKIEHLGQGLREALFAAPKVILNENIAEAQITEANLQDNSITADKIDTTLLQTRQNGITNWNFNWRVNSIENRHIADRTILGGYGPASIPVPTTEVYTGFKYNGLQVRTSIDADDDIYYTFTSDNIIDESITEALFGPSPGWGYYTRILAESQFDTGAIESRHITDQTVALAGMYKSNYRIPASALDPVIRAKLGV